MTTTTKLRIRPSLTWRIVQINLRNEIIYDRYRTSICSAWSELDCILPTPPDHASALLQYTNPPSGACPGNKPLIHIIYEDGSPSILASAPWKPKTLSKEILSL